MENNYLEEAFQELKILDEDVFVLTDKDDMQNLSSFMDDEVADSDDMQELIAIDTEADDEKELKDSYVGKLIMQCPACQQIIFSDEKCDGGEECVEIDDITGFANVEDLCPNCGASIGFQILGKVAAPEDEIKVSIEPKNDDIETYSQEKTVEREDENEEEIEEAIKTRRGIKKHGMKEELQNVQVETDNEKITIASEPKDNLNNEQVLSPLTDEDKENITKNYEDVDIDEFDEKEFNALGESYLKRVYNNVKNFETTAGSIVGNKMKLEGIITFKSGKQGKTNFVFEAHTISKNGKLKFIGENKQFARSKRAFTITGRVVEKKFCVESLTYNYMAKDNGRSKRLYGTVRK